MYCVLSNSLFCFFWYRSTSLTRRAFQCCIYYSTQLRFCNCMFTVLQFTIYFFALKYTKSITITLLLLTVQTYLPNGSSQSNIRIHKYKRMLCTQMVLNSSILGVRGCLAFIWKDYSKEGGIRAGGITFIQINLGPTNVLLKIYIYWMFGSFWSLMYFKNW